MSKKEKTILADQHTKTNHSSGGESDSESENNEVINLALMATHDSEASSSSAIKVRLNLDLNKCMNVLMIHWINVNQLVIQIFS